MGLNHSHFRQTKQKSLYWVFRKTAGCQRRDLVGSTYGKHQQITQAMIRSEAFRSFDSIKRLSIVHAGIFKPANHLHRYSRLSGADVTTELTKWKNGSRCQKSDFVGIGFRRRLQ